MHYECMYSIYIMIDGKQIRISDHTRPSYSENGYNIHDHEYDFEIISSDSTFSKNELESVGISLVGNYEYFLL